MSGIGGKDTYVMTDAHAPGKMLTIVPGIGGGQLIEFMVGEEYILFTAEQLRHAYEWLKSWDYV